MELGAVEEAIKGGLIGLAQRTSERGPRAAFLLEELTEGWQRSAHGV